MLCALEIASSIFSVLECLLRFKRELVEPPFLPSFEGSKQSSLLRDIFGNPFRPVTFDPAWLTWHDGLIVSMARKMYDRRDFSDTPVLADALEDAGCTDANILGHLRGPGPHVRGCWVVDLVLGKK
jgi:hypothetical protein